MGSKAVILNRCKAVPITVLVADDDDMIRDLLEVLIQRAGFQAVLTGSGNEALEAIRTKNQNISLAILDYDMPRLNGIETFSAMRLLRPDMKGILFTGNPNVSDLRSRCPDGLTCQEKVFDLSQLGTLMNKLLVQTS